MRFAKNCVCLLGACLSAALAAQTDTVALSQSLEWELKRDKDNIRVYTASVPDFAHAAVRGTMQIDATVSELVALVLDSASCAKWAALCKHSYVAVTRSPSDFDVYTYNDLPWPVKDRDAVTRVVWTVDADSGHAHMVADIIDDVVEPQKGALRLSQGVTSWTFTPNADGTFVESFAHIDPGGSMPAWVTNMLLVDSPFDTLSAMRDLVAEGGYKDAKVAFLSP